MMEMGGRVVGLMWFMVWLKPWNCSYAHSLEERNQALFLWIRLESISVLVGRTQSMFFCEHNLCFFFPHA